MIGFFEAPWHDKVTIKWNLCFYQLHLIFTENAELLNLSLFSSHLIGKFPLGPFSFESF